MDGKSFKCSVMSPERVVLECDATFVAIPAHDGEIGILPDRAPLVCKLGIGVMRIESQDPAGPFFIDGGFAQVMDNRVTILTEEARTKEQIDIHTARQDLDDALAMSISDEEAGISRNKAIERARVQIRLASD